MRKCGNCIWFTRVKSLKVAPGLCDKYDAVTDSESGRKCQDFKSRKYKRPEKKVETNEQE